MSDDYIRLIPADKNWQPAAEAAAAAAAYVTGLFSGPDGDVEEVVTEFFDQVTLIDAGANTTWVICPRCGGDLLEWFFDLAEEFSEKHRRPEHDRALLRRVRPAGRSRI